MLDRRLGDHSNIERITILCTTMIFAHVLNRGGRGVRSPADVLARRSIER